MKRYSIAEARDNLAAIVHELDTVGRVEITRRGQPVAILVSKEEYDRLNPQRMGFGEAYQKLRQQLNLSQLDIDPSEVFADLREKSPGREIDL